MTDRTLDGDEGSALDYFAILGVSRDASQEEIETRYTELTAHLTSSAIPANLREWAARQTALLDEAYAVLADPDRRAALTAPRTAPSPVAASAAAAPTPEAPSTETPVPAEPQVSAARALFLGVPWKLIALGAVIGLVVLGAVFMGSDTLPGLGGGDETTAANPSNEFIPVDTQRVAELMTQVEADANNQEALFELGEIYFLAGEWQAGIDWFTRLLALDPANVHALTDVGTANFNLARFEDARAAWQKGLEAEPDNVQLHYNMGFLYANVDPVDFEAARAEWQKVVELAPGSNLANTAQVHLQGLVDAASPAPAASPAGS